MKAILIEKNVPAENIRKEIIPIGRDCDFNAVYEVFEDVVGRPTAENIQNILLEYERDKERTLYGYFFEEKPVGIIGIKRNAENIEILHFGIHPEYRGKHLGTELMDYIKRENKTMTLLTDDDAVEFYKKYGYKCVEYYEKKYEKKRYNCVYEQ